MAQPDLTMAPPVMRSAAPKAKMTIYFALLIISLLAMLMACLFLYLEVRRFGGFGDVPGRVSMLERPAPSVLVDANDVLAPRLALARSRHAVVAPYSAAGAG